MFVMQTNGQRELPVEQVGDLLEDHWNYVLHVGVPKTWTKGYSPRFEGFSWEDAR